MSDMHADPSVAYIALARFLYGIEPRSGPDSVDEDGYCTECGYPHSAPDCPIGISPVDDDEDA